MRPFFIAACSVQVGTLALPTCVHAVGISTTCIRQPRLSEPLCVPTYRSRRFGWVDNAALRLVHDDDGHTAQIVCVAGKRRQQQVVVRAKRTGLHTDPRRTAVWATTNRPVGHARERARHLAGLTFMNLTNRYKAGKR